MVDLGERAAPPAFGIFVSVSELDFKSRDPADKSLFLCTYDVVLFQGLLGGSQKGNVRSYTSR